MHSSYAQGAVVNISSTAARVPRGGNLAYGVAKAAQDRLTQDLAFELAPKGVRVNSVLPGEVLASSQACTAIVGVVERAMHVITWASETSCSRLPATA